MRYLKFSTIICFICPATIISAAIELTGVIITPEKTLFAVADINAGASKWISVGQSFEGYEAFAYDANEETLRLKKGGDIIRVRLMAAQIKEGSNFVWVKPKPGEASVGLIAESRLELSIADRGGNLLYHGFLDPGEPRQVPRTGDLTITTETPDKLKVEIEGKQWPLQDPATKIYLKTSFIRAPRTTRVRDEHQLK